MAGEAYKSEKAGDGHAIAVRDNSHHAGPQATGMAWDGMPINDRNATMMKKGK